MTDNITVTHKDNDKLVYDRLDKNLLEKGQSTYIGEYWKLNVDGTLTEVFITEIEVLSVHIEYVVSERNYYIHYDIGHYKNGLLITQETLTHSEIVDKF